MREVARDIVRPRFERLQRHEVEEKSPGEMVTVVDRLAEWRLSAGLSALLPGSLVIGEEAAAKDADLVGRLNEVTVWLVDPLDGTANFVAGDPRFAVMVALCRAGETVGCWLLDVPADKLARAERGSGAFIEGRRIRCSKTAPPASELRGAVLTRYMPGEWRDRIEPRLPSIGDPLPGMRCAGLEYPAIATGSQHFALFWRTLPWDHAPGALFLAEAGGHVARLDGGSYRPGDDRAGLLVASNRAVWNTVSTALLA